MNEHEAARQFSACKSKVAKQGAPPDGFLIELIAWGSDAPDEIFAPNAVPVEIFSAIKSSLATPVGKDASGTPIYQWDNALHRRAALLETMRVHAGFESSWNWNEGVDKSNPASVAHKTGAETGIFQVSFDSEWLNHDAMKAFAVKHRIDTPETFIAAMKINHALAMEYYARLVRLNIRWAGPLMRHGSNSIYPWLSRAAVAEFKKFLTA
jgi:hypothetical protein